MVLRDITGRCPQAGFGNDGSDATVSFEAGKAKTADFREPDQTIVSLMFS